MKPGPARQILVLAGLIIGAALITWDLRRPPAPRPAPVPAAPAAGTTPLPAPARAPDGGTPRAEPAPPPAPPDPATLAAADARQDFKIARGLGEQGGSGVVVNASPPGSLTEQLRLQPGDIVLSVNGEPVATVADFVHIYRTEGLPTELTIRRKGREIHLH
ncbi:MAG: PDZ domain-containing protein [Proteobacteria bacterium]|nr:PDZ domain-containing protein [Pseudomonadota bacterium]